MAGTRTKVTVLFSAVVLVLVVAVVVKLAFFPSIKDAYFAMNDRSLLSAPAGLVVLRPTHYPFLRHDGIYSTSPPHNENAWRIMGRDVPFRDVVAVAYDQNRTRVVLPPNAPKGKFDFLVTVPTNQEPRLQAVLRQRLGYVAQMGKRTTNALALKVVSPALPGLKISTNKTPNYLDGKLIHYKVRVLIWPLENRIHEPVVDETGLTNFYNFKWDFVPRDRPTLNKMLARLGLGLEPKTEPVKMLIVKKAD